MKSALILYVAVCLAVSSVSGQWCWWCRPRCLETDVYFVPADTNVTTRQACAAAAHNATLSIGSYKHDQTIMQANQQFGVCSCEQRNCTDHTTNASSVSYVDCRFCKGQGKAIVVPTNVTCH